MRHWVLWPEPDLPRTSTGKIRRKAVAAWLAKGQAAASANGHRSTEANSLGASSDWLLRLVVSISGEAPDGSGEALADSGNQLRLTEDLHLDSLGRVQLSAALEERTGFAPESGLLEGISTLGELRRLVAGETQGECAAVSTVPSGDGGESAAFSAPIDADPSQRLRGPSFRVLSGERVVNHEAHPPSDHPQILTDAAQPHYIYPRWPWLLPFQWIRAAFIEAVVQPLVWLLANPKVVTSELPASTGPMLIIANHVTTFDGPLVQYALPGAVRRRIAVAMSGDMLEEYRHFRNPERPPGQKGFYLPGPFIYMLLTVLFNVFPLPRKRNFQRSFAHAGAAMDRGYNVLVFPEGTRSAVGELARFRGGIGLLAKESGAQVLPVAIRGLGELKAGSQRWFRSGKIEVHVGQPIRFLAEESEAAITARLHAEVERLLGGSN
jgi:long-chain acyl-CoA synthetase